MINLGIYKPRQSDWSEVNEVLDIIGRRDYGNFLYEYFPNLEPHTDESLTCEKLSEWYSGTELKSLSNHDFHNIVHDQIMFSTISNPAQEEQKKLKEEQVQ